MASSFRLIWGLVGGSTARFASFVRPPERVVEYMRGAEHSRRAGHNPVGGYSVLAMLLLLALQVASGLFATDVDGLASGPLSYMVSFDQGRGAAALHELSFNVLLAVIGLHVVAILFYLFVRRRNLVRPMITGAGEGGEGEGGALVPARPIVLVAAIALSGALAWWTSTGFIH